MASEADHSSPCWLLASSPFCLFFFLVKYRTASHTLSLSLHLHLQMLDAVGLLPHLSSLFLGGINNDVEMPSVDLSSLTALAGLQQLSLTFVMVDLRPIALACTGLISLKLIKVCMRLASPDQLGCAYQEHATNHHNCQSCCLDGVPASQSLQPRCPQ